MTTSEETTPVRTTDGAAGTTAHRRRGALHLLKVAAVDRVTDDAVAITFAVPDDLREEFAYLPGQHVAVRATVAGDDVRRNYSICAPAGSGVLRIGVKRLPDGVFSSFALDRLRVGDALEVLPPSGTFTVQLDPAHARHYGAIAAGSGITPVLSIVASALATEPGSRATVILANRTTSSIMLLEDLEDLKNEFLDRLTILHVLSREPQQVELLSGRLDGARLAAILDALVVPDVAEWFVCGPLEMTDMVRGTLLDRGVPDAQIRRELFHATAIARRPRGSAPGGAGGTDGTADPGDASTVTVRLDGRDTTFALPRGTDSILDAALRVRSELPFACKNGVCGTCRCRLMEGRVEMVQNFALEQDEVDRGFRLACQSYPISDTVVVDYDQ